MEHNNKQRAVIVDDHHATHGLVQALDAHGVACFHVQSSARGRPANAHGYHTDLGYLGNADEAAAALRGLAPAAIVPGTRWGVAFAEALATRAGVPTNAEQAHAVRHDKFELLETVRDAGLDAPDQALVHSAEASLTWVRARGKWPVVVKARHSAPSDGIRICYGERDVVAACAGHDERLIQAYVDGPQFIINTVSRDGIHYVTDAWHMAVRPIDGAAFAMEELLLLAPNVPLARGLIEYTIEVLDALGIRNGPANTEIRLTEDGPVIIDMAASLMHAAMDSRPYRAAGIETQADCLAHLLTQHGAGPFGAPERRVYTFDAHLTKVFFSFRDSGTVRNVDGLRRLASLSSFHSHCRPLAVGDQVARTSDMLGSGGVVYLSGECRSQLRHDVVTLRAWEVRGLLYDVRAAAVN
jgi:hypothetical protein